MSTYFFYSMILCLIVATAYMAWQLTSAQVEILAMKHELAKTSSVNPWRSQLMLMLKSDQQVPGHPMVTKGSMLYGALVMEELAETLIGLAKGIEQVSWGKHTEMHKLAVNYVQIAKVIQSSSIAIRGQIASLNEIPRPVLISKEIAREILDGVTDLHVVTAGLGLACGLPGQAAYGRVASSNLSKANPLTGVIDKTADGKWIKGSDYHEPSLDDLLDPHYAGVEDAPSQG